MRVDASEATGEIPLGKWESPFIVSRQLGQHEIVYGSIPHHMYEAAKPIFKLEVLQKDLARTLPYEIRESMVESQSSNQVTFTSPAIEFPALFLYQQDELIKDAVLLSAPSVRTLVEIFSGKGNRDVPTYDYGGNPTNGVSMQQLFHALSHHRYCVVSQGFIHDVFSGEDTRGLPDVFGRSIKVEEILNAVMNFLEGITVKDFVGMLRARLERLSIDSMVRDIIFAHQNVYVLTGVVRYRLVEVQFSPFFDYLFGQFTVDERRKVEAAKGRSTIPLERRFNLPRFKLRPDLDAKVIEMHITINGNQESFEFDLREFFEKLTHVCGNESIVPIERFMERVEDLGEPG